MFENTYLCLTQISNLGVKNRKYNKFLAGCFSKCFFRDMEVIDAISYVPPIHLRPVNWRLDKNSFKQPYNLKLA